AEQSFCILMTGQKLGADTRLRMETMVRTSDGFEIAEVDLRLRGPGDLEGTRQSGVVDLRLSDLARDGQILQTARLAAAKIIEEDVDLELDKHSIYRLELLHQQKGKPDWSQVG